MPRKREKYIAWPIRDLIKVAKSEPTFDWPAFQFWAKDWTDSMSIRAMSMAERGQFIMLLCAAWKEPDCGIPDDENWIATSLNSNLTNERIPGTNVLSRFHRSGGRLYNKKLLSIRVEAIVTSRARRKARESREDNQGTIVRTKVPIWVQPGSDSGSGDGGVGGSAPSSDQPKEPRAKDDPTWRSDFGLFLAEEQKAHTELVTDAKWIETMAKLNTGIDVLLSIEKARRYWRTEEAWKLKKRKRTMKAIDWRRTYENALCDRRNRVYPPRDAGTPDVHFREPTTDG